MATQTKFDMKKAMEPLAEAERRLVAIGLQLEGDIKRSMVAGTGRIYIKSSGGKSLSNYDIVGGKIKFKKTGNSSTIHVASEEGQPPAVDTGRLRASISTNWSESSFGSINRIGAKAKEGDGVGQPSKIEGKFTVVVGTAVNYAPFLEFGTRRMAARPFVRPAYDRMKNRIARMIVEER